MTPKKQVSSVIRISQGERDASARATHLEAVTRKFLVTTNERIQMSTKTNFKRVALVAVAALGLSLLSSAPSQAAVDQIILTGVANGTATPATADTTTSATIQIAGYVNVNLDAIQIEVVPKSTLAQSTAISANFDLVDTRGASVYVDSLSVGAANAFAAQQTAARNARSLALIAAGNIRTLAATNGSDTVGVVAGIKSSQSVIALDTAVAGVTGRVEAGYKLQLDTRPALAQYAAGAYTYTVIVRSVDAGTPNALKTVYQDLTITVSLTAAAAATAATAASAATSNIVVSGIGTSLTVADNAGTSIIDSAISVASTASTTNAGYVRVRLRNASSGNAQESVTATITAGTIGTATIRGRSVTVPYTAANVTAGFLDLSITPDGTSGTATISISAPSVTFTPKTMSFFARAAKTLVSTVAHPALGVGANTGAVRTTGLDAGGTAWAGAAYIYASSAADALIAGSATPVACSWNAEDSRHDCPVTGNTAGTAKMKVIDAATVALATATSNEVSVVVSIATATKFTLTFDKTSYAPNERARIYVTPVDAAGKTVPAKTFANLLATGGIVSNAGFSGTVPDITGVSIATSAFDSSATGAKAGALMYTVFMPAAGGTVTLTATGGASLPAAGQVEIKATATVADSGAAALAAVTVLQTAVASLKTLITTLTNLVLKIQKKVKA